MFIGAVAALSSCKSDSDTSSTPTPVVPVVVKDTVSAMLTVGGTTVKMNAKTIECNLYQAAADIYDLEVLGTDSLGNSIDVQARLRYLAPDSIITTRFNNNPTGKGSAEGLVTILPTTYTTKNVLGTLKPGIIKITKFDTTKMEIQGTFSYDAVFKGVTANVRGGKFRTKLTTTTLPVALPSSYVKLYVGGVKTLWSPAVGINPVISTVSGQKYTTFSLSRLGSTLTIPENMGLTISQNSGNQDLATGTANFSFLFNDKAYSTVNALPDAEKMKLQVDYYLGQNFTYGRFLPGNIKNATAPVSKVAISGNFYLTTP